MSAYSAADWDGFGTTAATAAATLTGLLFIAVSINLQRILENRSLPGRAAQTLIFFAVPLVGALLVVVPAQADAALGWELVATGVVIWLSARAIDHRSGPSRTSSRPNRVSTRLSSSMMRQHVPALRWGARMVPDARAAPTDGQQAVTLVNATGETGKSAASRMAGPGPGQLEGS